MRVKFAAVISIVLMLSVFGCSTGNERLIRGKWSLAGRMIGGAPSSFWFVDGSNVIGPWEKRNYATQSKGKYIFLDKKRIKITMKSGYYAGNTYFFSIVKIDEKEMILMNNFQEIKLKRRSDG